MLKIRIEILRKELYRIAEGKQLTDPEVIKASIRLDKLITEYQRMIKHSILTII